MTETTVSETSTPDRAAMQALQDGPAPDLPDPSGTPAEQDTSTTPVVQTPDPTHITAKPGPIAARIDDGIDWDTCRPALTDPGYRSRRTR